ncbi:MAG: rhodanese-like domain-containing protein [Elusimicrobiota bacterium]|jgi:adenylyltransferase/sulfurtransferase
MFFGSSDVPSITVEELKAKYDARQSFTLVDVREPDEHERCRLPGSKLIPLGELPQRFGELRVSDEIIVHCRSGGRSAKAARFLKEKGFAKVFNLTGGILAWAERVDPSMPKA